MTEKFVFWSIKSLFSCQGLSIEQALASMESYILRISWKMYLRRFSEFLTFKGLVSGTTCIAHCISYFSIYSAVLPLLIPSFQPITFSRYSPNLETLLSLQQYLNPSFWFVTFKDYLKQCSPDMLAPWDSSRCMLLCQPLYHCFSLLGGSQTSSYCISKFEF